jgi:hypothetical protein
MSKAGDRTRLHYLLFRPAPGKIRRGTRAKTLRGHGADLKLFACARDRADPGCGREPDLLERAIIEQYTGLDWGS